MNKQLYLIIASSLLINACQKASMKPQAELESDNFNDISNQFDKGEEVKLSRKQLAGGSQTQQHSIIGAKAINDVPQTRYSNYGYSPAINTFLGYADYMHWKDPSLISFTKIMVGKNAASTPPVFGGQDYCGKFDIKITSNQIERLLIGLTNSGFGQAVQVDDHTVSLNWRSGQGLYTGIIVGLKSPTADAGCIQSLPEESIYSSFDPFAVALSSTIRRNNNYTRWYGSSDPYANGYSGSVNGYYYAYPPPLCAPRHVPLSLSVSGTASNCDGTGVNPININLDSLVNDGSGYAPSRVRVFGKDDKHRFLARTINYSGADWYQPEQNNWFYPDYTNSCGGIANQLSSLKNIAQQCTSDAQCVPEPAISAQCFPSFVRNSSADVSRIIQLNDYYQRYCPVAYPTVLCQLGQNPRPACVERQCTWKYGPN